MARPYWSGQISISLVSFAVEIYPASNTSRPFSFHQIDRATGQRIHHENVAADGEDDGEHRHAVEKPDVVKGYEYAKGKYAIIEPEDLKRLRIPGKDTLEITQFSSVDELAPLLYERPYFVVPKKGPQAAAFAIVREAMIDTGTVGVGEIVFAGREHLAALAPAPDHKQQGMMLYLLRFAEELRDPAEYFGKVTAAKPETSQLDLAKQLIKTYKRPLELDKFTDDYEAAVRELVEAKLANKPLPKEKPKERGKVIDLMSALRQSLATKGDAKPEKTRAKSSSVPAKRKLKLVQGKRNKTA
jgi:DNA end-binding protein Ku